MARAALDAGVSVAAGDTKVVERGAADGLYVTTAGIGLLDPRVELGVERVRPGDRVLVSGGIAEHGIAVMFARGKLELELDVDSDTAPLHELTAALCALGPELRWMRDPTRGGLATTLNELAAGRRRDRRARGGGDPGARRRARRLRDPRHRPALRRERGEARRGGRAGRRRQRRSPLLRAHPLGAGAASTSARSAPTTSPLVLVDTPFGGSRIVDMLVGDPLPRIC